MLIETATITDQFHFLQHFLEQRVTRREKESSKKVSSLTFVAEMLLNKKKRKRRKIERGDEEKFSNYSRVITSSSGSSFRCQFIHQSRSRPGIVKCHRRTAGLTNGADSFARDFNEPSSSSVSNLFDKRLTSFYSGRWIERINARMDRWPSVRRIYKDKSRVVVILMDEGRECGIVNVDKIIISLSLFYCIIIEREKRHRCCQTFENM